jgi:hypothetical protein
MYEKIKPETITQGTAHRRLVFLSDARTEKVAGWK